MCTILRETLFVIIDFEERPKKLFNRIWNIQYEKIGIVESDDQHLAVCGIYIQVSHPDQKYDPWVIDFKFIWSDDENETEYGHSPCTVGNLVKCKHTVALLLYLTIYSIIDLISTVQP